MPPMGDQRWVQEIEHLFRMTQPTKRSSATIHGPYRGIFTSSRRLQEVELYTASRKRPVSAGVRHTKKEGCNDAKRPQTARPRMTPEEREAQAEQVWAELKARDARENNAWLDPEKRSMAEALRAQAQAKQEKLVWNMLVRTRQAGGASSDLAAAIGSPMSQAGPERRRQPSCTGAPQPPTTGCLSKHLASIIEKRVTTMELAELSSARQPSRVIRALMDCVCVLFGVDPPSWYNARTQLLHNLCAFQRRLMRFERNALTLEQRMLFAIYVRRLDKRCHDIRYVNRAAEGLYEWVHAIHTYYTAPTFLDATIAGGDPCRYLRELLEKQRARPTPLQCVDAIDANNVGKIQTELPPVAVTVSGPAEAPSEPRTAGMEEEEQQQPGKLGHARALTPYSRPHIAGRSVRPSAVNTVIEIDEMSRPSSTRNTPVARSTSQRRPLTPAPRHIVTISSPGGRAQRAPWVSPTSRMQMGSPAKSLQRLSTTSTSSWTSSTPSSTPSAVAVPSNALLCRSSTSSSERSLLKHAVEAPTLVGFEGDMLRDILSGQACESPTADQDPFMLSPDPRSPYDDPFDELSVSIGSPPSRTSPCNSPTARSTTEHLDVEEDVGDESLAPLSPTSAYASVEHHPVEPVIRPPVRQRPMSASRYRSSERGTRSASASMRGDNLLATPPHGHRARPSTSGDSPGASPPRAPLSSSSFNGASSGRNGDGDRHSEEGGGPVVEHDGVLTSMHAVNDVVRHEDSAVFEASHASSSSLYRMEDSHEDLRDRGSPHDHDEGPLGGALPHTKQEAFSAVSVESGDDIFSIGTDD